MMIMMLQRLFSFSFVHRSHDGGPRPAEDVVGAGAGRAGRLRDESHGVGGGNGEGCRVSLRPERWLLQHHQRLLSGQRGERRQDGEGRRRRAERPVWNQEGRHPGVREDVLDQSNPFVQLVSGVVWLLRNGEVYISESLKAECDKTQETGLLKTFVDVVSARTAVGHDAEGRLILFQIDGQTGIRGMNLWEVADFLKKYGVINAINLDGGGSSTYVTDGSLASYPSDHCESDSRWRCGRNVSTILCVHPRRCQPANCSGHGDCVDGRCRCQEGWRGAACDSLVCQPPTCGPHGVCTAKGCVCDAGWRGNNCSRECLPGFYGDACNQTCACVNGGSCDPVHGRCTCPSGFHGNTCDQACPLGFFGPSCAQECRCDDLCPCDPQTGSCNATLRKETNYTLHRAGHCLAKQMFTSWRRDEEAHREQPHLTERTWLIITFTLASLLSVSLLVHLVQVCRGSVAARLPEHRDYSYVPLNDINGAASRARADGGKGGFGLDDSDSQDEIWSPSGRS
ncbi:N-acetylglucosamine-1-phosphodiester alpha-N-acetylglucosaminidase isoform X2 [Dicentrarchus labrax]|uniref:N-acetylglucosamine-1-phosphodiester alpha-N-acetylglucosaminidase isoform X2 n=1 Tax=Dicentrarchus labrax TaxID=13489 RepID=UPI0021F6491E|nr:N-acetylglucosamine-1-phosphodiester alpha-N-acetylglucosaminidase isoform X2 [Dicentrarchus labrax]